MLKRWSEFRRRQRAALRESNRAYRAEPAQADAVGTGPERPAAATPTLTKPSEPGSQASTPAVRSPQTTTATADRAEAPGTVAEDDGPTTEAEDEGLTTDAEDDPATPAGRPRGSRYGLAGRPMNRQSPFYIGFVGALGALIAIGLWNSISRLTTTFTLLVVALFLTLALNPIVEWFARRGMRRGLAVACVFAGLVVVFVLLGLVVVPPVATQATQLTQEAPNYLQQLLDTPWVQSLDRSYHVVDRVQEEVTNRVQDPNFLSSVFGGVLGAGRALASGVFEAFTVLILTLYFLGSLPRVKQAAYALVPATRRPRFVSLSEEIMRRVGSYAIGQVAVAAVNAVASWIMMTIVGIPYAAVLAVAVGFLGLVPMVGASLGAVVVSVVAFFDEPRKAVIAVMYYVVYQQLENYLVAPRIMQRTVSVPGAVTVVAALAGGTLLGMLGALLAIPVAAGLLLLYEEVLVPRQRQH